MDIKKAIKKSGTSFIFNKGSAKAVEKMLSTEEDLLYACSVNVSIVPVSQSLKADILSAKNKLAGVLAVTTKRVLFCNSVLGQGTSKQILLGDITSVDDVTSILQFAKLRICGITETFVIDGGRKLRDEIRQAISEARL